MKHGIWWGGAQDHPVQFDAEPFPGSLIQNQYIKSKEDQHPTPVLGVTTKKGPILQIEITVNDLSVKAAADTGAEASLISEEVYNMLPQAARKPLKKTSLHKAGVWSNMPALGKLEVTFGSRSWS